MRRTVGASPTMSDIKPKKKPAKNAAPKAQKRERLVLLDAHAILHRAFHALPDFASPKGEPTGALYGVVAMLLKIESDLRPDHIIACFDLPEPTYRHDAFAGYKAKRVKMDDALAVQIERSRDVFAAFGIPIIEHKGFEADDMLGTLALQAKRIKGLDVIIASGDMDTLQIIDGTRVSVYTLRKGIKDTVMYDEAAVNERFGFGPELIPDYKGLRGDPSDNIPGIPGIGEKTATELIVGFGSIEQMYTTLKKGDGPFLKAGIKPRIIELLKAHEEEAIFSKMLATIRCDAPVVLSLSKESWRDLLDVPRILTLFSELGFRTLGERVKALTGGATEPEPEEAPREKVADVDKDALMEASIALWILSSDITNPSLDEILEYGRNEGKVEGFAASHAFIMRELERAGLTHVFTELERPLIPVLRRMEQTGVLLDVPYLKTLETVFAKELKERESKIHKAAGGPFNINSPKQLGDILFDTLGLKPDKQKRTSTGQRSTRETELEKLRGEHPIIEDILRYRELQKLLSTYVETLPQTVAADGRVHTTFIQSGAATGRMASENPNLQNIPIRTEEGRAIRRAFIATEGFELVAIDYSQIELRVAAIMSGDSELQEIFKRGEDVHSGVASRVFKVPEGAVDAEMRRKAKVINFGILYGMGVNALRANLGSDTPRSEAQEFLSAYFNTFTRLATYLEETKGYARTHGYTETLFGRRRAFRGIRSSIPFVRAAAERMAINAPIQGTAADMLKVAMIRIDALLQKKDAPARMLLQIHDELLFEVKKGERKIIDEIVDIMESVLEGKNDAGVPIIADVKIGKNWGEMEKLPRKK